MRAGARLVLVSSVLLLLSACSRPDPESSEEPPPSGDAVARISNGLLPAVVEKGRLGQKASIPDRMAHYGVPGLSIAVIHDGKLAWESAFGVTAAVGGDPVTRRTMFQAASISKPVTAVAALILVQDGLIDLDDEANTYLKSWEIPENDFTRTEPVTVRGLLSHTSGFSGNAGVIDYMPGSSIPTLIQALKGEPPSKTGPVRVTAPLGKLSYSGSGYVVLQQTLVDMSGEPFDEFMRETVLAPLEMNHSTFDQAPPVEGIAKGHHAGGEPLPGGYRVHSGEAAAGLWSTASDLAKFAVSIQQAASGRAETLLTRETAAQMLRSPLLECFRCWGLGFELLGEGADLWFTHDGINMGFDSKLLAHSSSGDGAVVMTNGSLSFGLIYEILDSIAAEYNWPDYAAKGQIEAVPIPAEALMAIPGEYELEPDFAVSITAENERLFFHIPTQGRTELYASSPESFFITALDWGPMTFVSDESGQVTDMMIGHPGQQTAHPRLR